MDKSLGEYADAMVAIDHHHFGVAIRIDRVIGKADLVALASGVNDEICTSHFNMNVNVVD